MNMKHTKIYGTNESCPKRKVNSIKGQHKKFGEILNNLIHHKALDKQ